MVEALNANKQARPVDPYAKGSPGIWNISSWDKADWYEGWHAAGGNKLSVDPCLLLMPNTCGGWAGASLWHGSCGVFGEKAASLHGWGCYCTVPATTVMSGVTLKTLLWNWNRDVCCHHRPFFLPFRSHDSCGLFLIYEIANPILSYLLWSPGQALLMSCTTDFFPITADPCSVFPSLPVAAPGSSSLGVIPSHRFTNKYSRQKKPSAILGKIQFLVQWIVHITYF